MFLNILLRILPFLIVAGFWWPLFSHNFVVNETVDGAAIEKARQLPADSDLDGVRSIFELNLDQDELVRIAQKLLAGEADIPGMPKRSVRLPFDEGDVSKGPVQWQLELASFKLPAIVLAAFEATGQEIYLKTARDIILHWAEYEKKRWMPKGFIWNDHAVAARIAVLARFWKLYRRHPLYDPDSAQRVFGLILRSAKRLAKPAHYTFWSNHGLMQNIALLQLCVAFPVFPQLEAYQAVAIDRLRQQLSFYINSEGVVLEHSPGYHRDGITMLSNVFRLLAMLEYDIPDDWKAKYDKALTVYSQLRRPDGTLPMIGDTGPSTDQWGPLICRFNQANQCTGLFYRNNWDPTIDSRVYPIGGMAVWWEAMTNWQDGGALSQTTFSWANFQDHAHKHADELSLVLWAAGHNWWTNVGYYPYGEKYRRKAISWDGSNAPHFVGEAYDSERNVAINGHDDFQELNFIDLSRESENGFSTRRQVFHIKAHNVWGVLDYNQCNQDCTVRTIWTTSPEISLTRDSDTASYTLKPDQKDMVLKKYILSSNGGSVNVWKGSEDPFAGWVVTAPSSAIVVDQPQQQSWTLYIWYLNDQTIDNELPAMAPTIAAVDHPLQWHINIPVGNSTVELHRMDGKINLTLVTPSSQETRVHSLSPPPEYRDEQMALEQSYLAGSHKYPFFHNMINRRQKASLVILGLFLIQEVGLLVVNKKKKSRPQVEMLMVVVWGSAFFYLNHYYLAV
jgi:hypothetical protein